MEDLEMFVKRFSKAVGCHYHITKRRDRFSLKKYETNKQNHMGVFGWIYETKDAFKIETYEYLANNQGKADADAQKRNMNWDKAGLRYSVRKGSNEKDFQKAVRALKVVLKNR